jgi:hypothetical protein
VGPLAPEAQGCRVAQARVALIAPERAVIAPERAGR